MAGSGSKVVIRRADKHAYALQSGDRKLVKVLEFVSSRGGRFNPLIIFKGAKVQTTWVNAWSGPVYAVSDNGWTDQDHGASWLKKVFDPQTKDLGGRRLLFLDGHNSHVSAEFITACWERDIVPLCLPPHTTHCLQQLDVGCFGPLDKAYKRELEKRSSMGVVEIDKTEFLILLKQAREKKLTSAVIMSAWAAAGIHPYDPDAVLSKLPQASSSFTPETSQTNVITPTDRENLLTAIDSLNPYTPTYKSDLRRLKATVNGLYSDIDLSRDNTRKLFKANMARVSRKNKKTEKGQFAFDGTAFGRLLTEKDVKRYREEEVKKAEQLCQVQEMREDKKVDTDTKKMVHAWEVEDRKRKRIELKAQKDMEKDRKKAEKELEKAMKPKRKRRNRSRIIDSPPSDPNPRSPTPSILFNSPSFLPIASPN